MPFFVDVILPLPIPKLFTYLVTDEEYDFIQPGIRIVVPFGNTKKYAALSHRTHQNTPPYEAKSIEYIIDQQPVVSSRQLELWEWISHYYMSPLGSVFRTAVPSILLLESETELHFHNSPSEGHQTQHWCSTTAKCPRTIRQAQLVRCRQIGIVKKPIQTRSGIAQSRFDSCSGRSLHKV